MKKINIIRLKNILKTIEKLDKQYESFYKNLKGQDSDQFNNIQSSSNLDKLNDFKYELNNDIEYLKEQE